MPTGKSNKEVTADTSVFSGSVDSQTVALVNANTWYSVPSSAPLVDYNLVVTLENAAGTVRWNFSGDGTPSAVNGNKAPKHLAISMAANSVLYYGSSIAGDDVNYTYKERV